MPTQIPREIINNIMSLRGEGNTMSQIADRTGVKLRNVKAIVQRENKRIKSGLPTVEERREALKNNVANARLNHTASEVAKIFGISIRHVFSLTKDHRSNKSFKKDKTTGRPKGAVRASIKIRKKDIVVIDQKQIQKGHVKLQKNEKVFETKKQDFTRSVSMHDSKNTVLFIKSSDKRSDEQIRKEWLSKREGELRRVS